MTVAIENFERRSSSSSKTLSWYVVFGCLVVPICSVIPLSFVYVLLTLVELTFRRDSALFVHLCNQLPRAKSLFDSVWWTTRIHYFLFVYAILENWFFLLQVRLHHTHTSIKPGRSAPRRISTQALRDLLEKCLEATGLDEQEIQFTKWFYHAPLRSLKRDNIREWVAWMLFSKHMHELTFSQEFQEDEVEVVDKVTDFFEEQHRRKLYKDFKFPEGYNPNVKAMRLSLDPVQFSPKPLMFYLFVNAIGFFTHHLFAFHGFTFHRHRSIDYYIYLPKNCSSEKLPVVFVHGIGIGLTTYLNFILDLKKNADESHRALCLISLPHVSMSIFHRHWIENPPRDDAVKWINEALRGHCQDKDAPHNGLFKNGVCLISHSVGSVIAGWLIKYDQECRNVSSHNHSKYETALVRASVFVDPVVYRLWEADVCLNFIYKTPEDGVRLFSRWFIAGELGISKFLTRAFWWWECLLFREQVGYGETVSSPLQTPRSIVILSQKDNIIDASRVNDYLTQSTDPGYEEICERENAADEIANYELHPAAVIEEWDDSNTPKLRVRHIVGMAHGAYITFTKRGRREIVRSAERLCRIDF